MKMNASYFLVTGVMLLLPAGISADGFFSSGRSRASYSPYDKCSELKTLEVKQKNSCLQQAKDAFVEKFKLLEDHNNECLSFHKDKINAIKKNGCSSEIEDDFLHRAVELYEKQLQDWYDMGEKNYRKMGELHTSHRKELEKFKKTIGYSR